MKAAANILGGNDTATFTSADDHSQLAVKKLVDLEKTDCSPIYSD